jgi:putative oxidoreductase
MTTSTQAITTPIPTKGVHIGLWIAQSFTALAFLGAGSLKLTKPIAELATKMSFVPHFPDVAVRAIGAAEVLGAVGLILPMALRIAPWLTPLAAAGLTVLMLGGAATHAALGDPPGAIVPSLVLASLSAWIAWGRRKAASK